MSLHPPISLLDVRELISDIVIKEQQVENGGHVQVWNEQSQSSSTQGTSLEWASNIKLVSHFGHHMAQNVVFLEIYRRFLGSVKCFG